MSGTSLDGVDAVLADFAAPSRPHQLGEIHLPFESALRESLLHLSLGGAEDELEQAGRAGVALAKVYANAARLAQQAAKVMPADVLAIGCHGQTVRHRPEQGFTVQLGNPALLAELTGVLVVTDFRSRDIAAGGQGAPLVPAFHRAVFHAANADRVIVNIGGIANLTYLPRTGEVAGFDCGPGNVLMDVWISRHLGENYDSDGEWARTGKLLPDLLQAFCKDPYFHQSPPKSTGRERFNLGWLESLDLNGLRPEDVQRTLLELTVTGIADAIKSHCCFAQQVFLCGGGACNGALLEALRNAMPELEISTTASLGIPVMNVEALAFAWLARQTLHHKHGNLPAVTGARHAAVLGAIYPR